MDRRLRIILASLLVATTVSACGQPAGNLSPGAIENQERVRDCFDHTCRMLREISRNPAAQLSYSSLMEQGGNLKMYFAVNCGPEDDWASLVRNEHGDTWCVVARPAARNRIVVEAIGDSPTVPLYSEQIEIRLTVINE